MWQRLTHGIIGYDAIRYPTRTLWAQPSSLPLWKAALRSFPGMQKAVLCSASQPQAALCSLGSCILAQRWFLLSRKATRRSFPSTQKSAICSPFSVESWGLTFHKLFIVYVAIFRLQIIMKFSNMDQRVKRYDRHQSLYKCNDAGSAFTGMIAIWY